MDILTCTPVRVLTLPYFIKNSKHHIWFKRVSLQNVQFFCASFMVIMSVHMTMAYDSVSIAYFDFAQIAKAILFDLYDANHPSCTACIGNNKRAYHCCNIGYYILFYHFVLLVLLYFIIEYLNSFIRRILITKLNDYSHCVFIE